MTIVRKIKITDPAGAEIKISDWANTLIAEDKALYDAAAARQESIRQELENSRKMTTTDSGKTVFLQDTPPDESELVDSEWKAFFDRFLTETGQTIEITDEKL